MKTIYAIFDRKTNTTALCKDAVNVDEFQRWFATVFLRDASMLRDASIFALYPEDYDIYSICTFDEENMTVPDSTPPRLICSVDELFSIFKLPRPTSAQSGE